MNDEVFYTASDVAWMLCYHPRSIQQMCRDGRIKANKTDSGRKWLISKTEVDRLKTELVKKTDEEIIEDIETSQQYIATLPPKSWEKLIEVASDLLANDLDRVWEGSDPSSPYEYYWVDHAGGIPALKQEISVQLSINEEEASFRHKQITMSHFRIHLEQEVKADHPELSQKDYSTIWAEHTYEIIDTLRLLVEIGTFRSTCYICKV